MSDRFDVVSFRKSKNDKVYAIRLGSASKRDDGGFNAWLDALPAPGASGSYEIQIVPQREKPAPAPNASRTGEIDDEIPF